MKKSKSLSLFSIILIVILLQGLNSCKLVQHPDSIREGFINPPDSCKPGVYWYFMDGNLDKGAVTRDLESMKDAGIGYVLFLEVNVGVPRGRIDFLSDEWQDIFTHAVRECERLGIRLILGSGPGWAGSGGPWVKPEESMMHLVARDTIVSGPSLFNTILPLPAPRTPYFGEGSLTPSLRELRNKWYEDVRILAFPMPEKNARIDRIDEKALYYRAPYTSVEGVLPYIPFYDGKESDQKAIVNKGKIIDLTYLLQKDGSINWNVPPGKWVILRFVKRNNGAVTRPAPVPGLGFEADKLDTAAFRAHYNNYIGRLIEKVKPLRGENGGGWTMIHIDSWEMGSQNWTNRFIEEFIRRRGYDPILYLPVYAGYIVNSDELSERFLWDIRQTANELVLQNHAEWFRETGRKNGFKLSIEPYDMNPSSDIDLGAVADVPMCEFWSDGFGYNSSFSCFESTSAAHLTGKPVVAAESFTADGSEAWKKYPGNMKNQTDWAFAMGINRLIFHTFAHKPYGDSLRPGVTMGPYGVHWDRGQTWWPMVGDYHEYISRAQYLLSLGSPVADILFLTPEGAPQVFLPPADALEGTSNMPDKKGYSFDACSPALLIKHATVREKRIIFPGGASYRILILPYIKSMTPELVKKIELLVKNGASVLGLPPNYSPSLSSYPQCDNDVRNTVGAVWGEEQGTKAMNSHFYYSGTMYWPKIDISYDIPLVQNPVKPVIYPKYKIIEALLRSVSIAPDFISAGNYRFIHRKLPDREVYFVSNRSPVSREDSCRFRDGTFKAEQWNPLTGSIKELRDISKIHSGVSIKLDLEPYESTFIVFYKPEEGFVRDSLRTPVMLVRKVAETIPGPWNIRFADIRSGAKTITSDSLPDWSRQTDNDIRYYSGKAVYTTSFRFTKPKISGNERLYIDLGKVRNICRIRLNSKDLGVLWTDPWRKDVTSIIKNGRNELEVEVINLWINRLIGDEEKPWDGVTDGKWPAWLTEGVPRTSGRVTFTTHRFYKAGDPLSESGLLGPVNIITESSVPVK
ncbi:MAG: glycosyl hydrolase [Bacteroidales bacterium]